jgi:hypothetical protein
MTENRYVPAFNAQLNRRNVDQVSSQPLKLSSEITLRRWPL